MLFIDVILPVFLIVLSGFCLEKKTRLDAGSLTAVSLYLMAPALVFSALVKNPVDAETTGRITLFMLFYLGIMLLAAYGVCRLLRITGNERKAFYLATAMMNIGNFGLPLVYFAYGDAALKISILIFVLFNIPLGTLAIMIAQKSRTGWTESIANMLKIPIFHAVAVAFLVQATDIRIPAFLMKSVEMLGQGAIPLMLIILGMQLARTRIRASFAFLGISSLLRLIVAPLIAWILTELLAIDGLAQNIVILQTSTPAAVLPLLYSVKFDTRPDLVAGSILVSTLLSSITLTILLYLLK